MSKWLMVPSLNNNILSFDNFKTRRALLLSVLCFCLSTSLTSCKKDKYQNNNTGKEILDENILLNLKQYEYTDIATKTVMADALRTDEISSTVLLGSYVDPVFGKSSAEIYTQIRLESQVDFTPKSGNMADLSIDSVFLQLPLNSYYGTLDPQTFEVYQLNEKIFLDSAYYSDDIKNINTTNYVKSGFETITPNTTDFVKVGGELKIPMLRIRLDESLATLIINESGKPSLSSNDNSDGFVSWFKGLLIKTNTTQGSGDGAILGINISSDEAKIVLNYTDNSEADINSRKTFDFDLGTQIAYYNHFNHDYTSTAVETAINNTSLNSSEYYIQSMSGTSLELDFTTMHSFSPGAKFVVNKAELILPIEYDASSSFKVPPSIFVFGYNDEGENIFLPDQFLGNIGGVLNTSAKNYTFNITSYINKLLSGEWSKNTKLSISSVGAAVSAYRIVGKGKLSSSEKPVLKLYYTTY